MRPTISARSSAGDDMRAALAGKRRARALEVRDDRALPAAFHVPDGGLDLRAHAAQGEVTGAGGGLELGEPHAVEEALLRLAEVDRDAIDRREDEQRADAEGAGEQRGSEVLVDHAFHAQPIAAGVAHHGYAAAAA